MRKAVLKGFLSVIVIGFFICGFFFVIFMSEATFEQTKKDMLYSVKLIDYSIDYNKNIQRQIENLNPLVLDDSTRISVIDKDGSVIADTSKIIDKSDNHLDRDEIKSAFDSGVGISHRYSGTIKKELLYVSFFSEKGDCVVRLSIPYNGIVSYINAVVPVVLISISLAFAVAFFLADKISKNVTEPIYEISEELLKIQNSEVDNETINLREYKYSELNDIANSAKVLSQRIEKTVERLRYEKNKIDYILDNMSEGFIFIDENKNVVTINKSAMNILNCGMRGYNKNILHYTQNMGIIDNIQKVTENGKSKIFDISYGNGEVASVRISKIKRGIFDKSASGIGILIIDVTADRKAQAMRQEFFSNASHELKTPITSISGFAEILSKGIVKDDEKQREYFERIRKETQNMTVLINDILMISRLETKVEHENDSNVNMKSIVEDIVSSVLPICEQNNISVITDCQDVVINADYNLLYQLVNNLISNSVKYNKEGGTVFIKVETENDKTKISVKDTGIGIPPESQQRVFERFYRVDKGRSKKMGGNGLGLSIVKHVVNYYNGTIELKSKIDVGTEIIVII